MTLLDISYVLLKNQQFVVTHRYTIWQETKKKLDRSLIDQRVRYVLRKYTDKQFFCGHNLLTERVFVTGLYSSAEIALLETV